MPARIAGSEGLRPSESASPAARKILNRVCELQDAGLMPRSIRGVAEALGVAEGTLRGWREGRVYGIQRETLGAVARALSLNLYELLALSGLAPSADSALDQITAILRQQGVSELGVRQVHKLAAKWLAEAQVLHAADKAAAEQAGQQEVGRPRQAPVVPREPFRDDAERDTYLQLVRDLGMASVGFLPAANVGATGRTLKLLEYAAMLAEIPLRTERKGHGVAFWRADAPIATTEAPTALIMGPGTTPTERHPSGAVIVRGEAENSEVPS